MNQQEPVAWMFQNDETGNISFLSNIKDVTKFQEQNPRWHMIPLYSAPLAPKRIGEMEWHWGYERGWDKAMERWVSLTDEELKEICQLWEIVHGGWITKFAKDIEAKLKEKNT